MSSFAAAFGFGSLASKIINCADRLTAEQRLSVMKMCFEEKEEKKNGKKVERGRIKKNERNEEDI